MVRPLQVVPLLICTLLAQIGTSSHAFQTIPNYSIPSSSSAIRTTTARRPRTVFECIPVRIASHHSHPHTHPHPRPTTIRIQMSSENNSSDATTTSAKKPHEHCEHVLFVECGFGNDSHGQNPTKAAVRACRNAIEFNSIPSINKLVPGGYDNLKLDVILAIPPKYQDGLDLGEVRQVFPYGECKFTIQDGGMVAPSGIAIDALGDKNDDMVVVCCAVTVGY